MDNALELTVNETRDLQGPLKFIGLRRYRLFLGINRMVGVEDEQAFFHAFSNACKAQEAQCS